MRWNSTILLLTIGFWSPFATRSLAWAGNFDVATLQAEITETIERVRPSAVSITGRRRSFSGVIVSTEGHVLSVAHAVEPGARYRVNLPDGRQFHGIGKGANPWADAALIKIVDPPADLPFVPMGDSSSLVTHQPCLGLSYPGGQKGRGKTVVRFGHVVRNGRHGMLQSSVLMEPGDSGGPLFDLNGCVVGIHSRIGASMDRNFEVPVNVFRRYWNELNYERVFTHSGLPMPILGARLKGPQRDEKAVGAKTLKGLAVEEVLDGGMAAQAGIQNGDCLLAAYGRELADLQDLHESLMAAHDEGAETVRVTLLRDDKEIELNIAFDGDREAAPEVPLPQSDRPKVPAPEGHAELSSLAGQFAEFEAALDDACVKITSTCDKNARRTIAGTRVMGTAWIVSKSTEVGEQPEIELADETVALQVIARDANNDLVLLRAPMINETGVDLDQVSVDIETGTFVLSPNPDGHGLVSVVGSAAFRSDKQQSRGFFGVTPGTYGNNKGAILTHVSDDGPAMRAGLLVGDIITKLNKTIIYTQNDLRSFLAKADPNTVVQATLRRDKDELVRSVMLSSVPVTSSHPADQVVKSGRRDGFANVVPHDADLKPDECGGPLFTLRGDFVGVNIARYSRVRSYVLTADVVRNFLKVSTAQHAQ